MLYLTEVVRGRPTVAISGDMNIVDALNRLLEGSGLVASFTSDYSFATVTVAPPDQPPSVAAGAAVAADAAATANESRAASAIRASRSDERLSQVVITGTLLPSVQDVTSPLQVIRKQEIPQAAYATVRDALQTLPVSYGGGPSEDFGTSGNFARGTSANLRGLGSAATLVLLNGRRLPYAGNDGDFVDLSLIPWSAVKQIEVMPDGASAIYGADAIAGVVNLITKTPDDPSGTTARMSSAREGALERLMSQALSFDWKTGDAIAIYEFQKRDGLAASARAYAASSDKRSLGGSDYRSINSAPGNILNPFTLLPEYGLALTGDTATAEPSLRPGSFNLLDRERDVTLLPERTSHSAYAQLRQSISDGLSASADVYASKRDVQYQNWSTDALLRVPESNPHTLNPYPGVPFTVIAYSFLADLGPTVVDASTQQVGGTFRLDARLPRQWRVSLAGDRGDQHMTYTIHNQVNATALQAALDSADSATAFNPWAPGTSPAAVVDAIRADPRGTTHSSISTASLVATGPLIPVNAGDVHAAVGVEWREESFDRTLPQLLSVDRTVRSVFTELSVPIIGDAQRSHAPALLDLSLSGRLETYSDFGSSFNPKMGLRWTPSDRFKMRATYGTSFRAPRLSEPYSAAGSTSIRVVPDPSAPAGVAPVIGIVGSRDDLTHEQARTWSVGADLALPWADGFTASATWYSLDYKDRIAVPGPPVSAEILLNESMWSEFIVRHPTHEQILAACGRPDFQGSVEQCASTPIAAIVDFRLGNMAQTRVRGVDAKVDQRLRTPWGLFQFSGTGSYIDRFDQRSSGESPTINLVGTVGYPNALRVRGALRWFEHDEDRPGFAASMSMDRFSSYRDRDRGGREVKASSSVDVRLSYRTAGVGPIEFALSATNVFDRPPPFVDREAGYDQQGADPTGRVLVMQIEKQW